MSLFVKFVPWNERTLSCLINKTIKFSTVFEFNDFNEYRYISCLNLNKDENFNDLSEIKSIKILEKEVEKFYFIKNLTQLSKEKSSPEFLKKITNHIEEGKLNKLLSPELKCLSFLEENLAFGSVGIFCMSDIAVFNDDSAQLMFAHYAENLSGLALIYRVNNFPTLKKIQYENSPRISSGLGDRIVSWFNHDYTNIDDFLFKSEKWQYECEWRIFNKPGLFSSLEKAVDLVGILYTPRFKGNIEAVNDINKQFYGELFIEKIYPANSSYSFLMEKKGEKTSEFLVNFEVPKI